MMRFVIFILALVWTSGSSASEEFWTAMREPGVNAIMRHAIAPGTGDPSDFTIGDCATQRNLNDTGRDQAATIGQAFRDNGIVFDQVLSSQWCRCLETAELLDLGPVEALERLNSFFRNRGRRSAQTEATRSWILEQPIDSKAMLVTHQVNVTALTGVYPTSGEVVAFSLDDNGDVTVHATLSLR